MGEKLKYQPLLKTGEYVAEIVAAKMSDGKFGQQVEVKFELCAPHVGREITGWASAKFTPSTKLYRWWAAATRGELKATANFDTDQLVGRTVTLVIVQYTTEKNVVTNRIENVLEADEEDVVAKIPDVDPAFGSLDPDPVPDADPAFETA